jgi:hypothetical protein
LPPPDAITSAPPPPSTLSLPEPVLIAFAADEPVTVSAELSAEASTLSKFATLTVSPVVWSEPAVTVKLMAVVLPDTASTSVSVPEPPSIEVSVPR